MKLGVMAALFAGRALDEVLEYCAESGLDAIEIPVGAYPGKPFFEPLTGPRFHPRAGSPKGDAS